MAYNKGYNPDALPAHVTPDMAAQILSEQQTSHTQQKPLPPNPSIAGHNYDSPRRPSYENKPPPPIPSQAQQLLPQQNRYARPISPGLPPPRHNYAASPPPPQNYGYGPPPKQPHGRPPPQSQPPPTTNYTGADSSLFPLFRAVDKDGSGHLSESELRTALVNGDMTSFDPHTVKMMIRMFDTSRSGTINFDEFCRLWAFLASWRTLFDRFDADASGTISFDEFTNALMAFGYRLSEGFVRLLFGSYDKGTGMLGFDLFVQSCIGLKRMTDVFKRYDGDRDGYITLSFEEFLTEILRQR